MMEEFEFGINLIDNLRDFLRKYLVIVIFIIHLINIFFHLLKIN